MVGGVVAFIVRLESDEHWLNTWLPMLVMPLPIVTDARLEHKLNACVSIEVTLSGMSILVKDVQPLNALPFIDRTPVRYYQEGRVSEQQE